MEKQSFSDGLFSPLGIKRVIIYAGVAHHLFYIM